MQNNKVLNGLAGQFEFAVKVCSAVNHDKNWVEHESKNNYALWLVTHGALEIVMDGKAYRLEEGDVFFFHPQRLYTARSLEESCVFIFARFDILMGTNIRPLESFLFDGFVPGKCLLSHIAVFLEDYSGYRKGRAMSALTLKAGLARLVSGVIAFKMEEDLIRLPQDAEKAYVRLEKVLSHITRNLHRPLSVKELAELSLMSEKYFITHFKSIMGITPFVYISRLKLKEAMSYLMEGIYSVKEIAEMLGYSDPYVFSKAFKRYYGFAPTGTPQSGLSESNPAP